MASVYPSATQTSITLNITFSGLESAYTGDRYLIGDFAGQSFNEYAGGGGSTASFSVTASGLSPGTTYSYDFTLYYVEGTSVLPSSYSVSGSANTLTPTPTPTLSISITEITDSSAVLSGNFTNGEDTSFQRYLGYSIENNGAASMATYIIADDKGGTSDAFSGIIDGLTPNTNYTIEAWVAWQDASGNINDEYDISDEVSFITLPKAIPNKWNWYESNGDATAAQTKKFFQALNGAEMTDTKEWCAAVVWNDLVNKVKEVLDCENIEWKVGNTATSFGYVLDISNIMASPGTTLTAVMFNTLSYQINQIFQTGSIGHSGVYSGEQIKGQYFLNITNAINQYITNVFG